MLIKLGKNGYFLGCSGYPECTNTREFTRDETGKILSVEPERAREPGCGLREVRLAHGDEERQVRTVHGLQQVSRLQQHQAAHQDRGHGPEVRQMRLAHGGEAGEIRAVPRMQRLSQVQEHPALPARPQVPHAGMHGRDRAAAVQQGKMYYSCSVKDCTFISWSKPVPGSVPRLRRGVPRQEEGRLELPEPGMRSP